MSCIELMVTQEFWRLKANAAIAWTSHNSWSTEDGRKCKLLFELLYLTK